MTRYEFRLTEWHRHAGWGSTRKKVDVTGAPVEELAARLKPWALGIIAGEGLADGEYRAHLVELTEDGYQENLEIEDVFWFYGTEYVPAS